MYLSIRGYRILLLEYWEPKLGLLPANKTVQHLCTVQPEWCFFVPPHYSWITDPSLQSCDESQLVHIYQHNCGDNRTALHKNCDRILNMEVSQEDLLKESECDVDSTTEDSLVKKHKPANAKKKI